MTQIRNANDIIMKYCSLIATLMFFRAIYKQCFPQQWREVVHSLILSYTNKVVRFFSPYLHITFDEYTGQRFAKSKAFSDIETYLSEKASTQAKRLRANFVKDGKEIELGLASNEEVIDEFNGVKVWWTSRTLTPKSQTISVYPGTDARRNYRLTFHARHRELITESYLTHVLEEGKAITTRKRQRKLFTNIDETKSYGYRTGSTSNLWCHVEFKHPATFDTLAMEPTKKQRILRDLLRFRDAKSYYTKIGKPWKRGYLLYGPPGTGKSTMIVAMANLLEYDVYDLELTAVKDNTQLRRLLIETTSKSIIVIEDIDCSLDLTGQRSKKKKNANSEDKEQEKDEIEKKIVKKLEPQTKTSQVTLSGLLNFIDGIWSACGEERLIIFTTNYVEKLDPALVRRGRMDMHIELSFCCYESFKVLARNYLDVESHPLFEVIKGLLEETKMTPADVAENLMPQSSELEVDGCLENLVQALEKVREENKSKAEEKKDKLNAEEDSKLKEKEGTGKGEDENNLTND